MLGAMIQVAAIATDAGSSTDISSLVGLINYGVLGIITVGFIRGWVVSPKERDSLKADLDHERAEKKAAQEEVARLNQVIQDNLTAMTVTMDKQLDLAAARVQERAQERSRRDDG